MKSVFLKITSFALAAVFLLSPLTACKDSSADGVLTSEANYESWPDDIPLDVRYKGETMVFLYSILEEDPTFAPMAVETVNNDVLNDAIYNREQSVEERLNVKIEFVQDPQVETKASISIKANLDEYQLLSTTRTNLAMDGLLCNLLDGERVPHIDLSKPYWSQLFIEQATMYDQLYIVTGALSMALTKSMYNVYFNKEMVKNAGVPNLYKVINDGDWTLDYMLDLIKGSYVDVTGNGKTDDDIYGLLMDDARIVDTFWSGFDLSVVSRDSDGNPVLDIDKDKMGRVVDKLREMQNNMGDVYCIKTLLLDGDVEGEDLNLAKFAADEGMFFLANIYMTDRQEMRNMDGDYGIIPVPKWDEFQKDYYTFNNAFDMYGIPTSVRDTARASAVLEALASFSYMSVAPAYYDKVLNGRYTRDLESTEMLDLMVKNVKLDFGWIYDWELEKIAQNSLRYLVRDESISFSTYWRRNGRLYETAFGKLTDKYKEMAKEQG